MSTDDPRDELAEAVIAVWADLLDRPAVDMSDDFFRVGGNSLLAARLIQQLQAAFDIRLKLIDFFDDPTPLALCELVRSALERQLDAMSDDELMALLEQETW
ncbi:MULTISPECIES: phosphopantetheine-binding protein [Nocardia]|uniref:phosphopantetheine-binding protein n=1 Tax=Nocardia abscessus TaxID=120957 RepID=UPI001892E519|nr:phosphopantetheine-binding protein [Nocardia abscessus]MBF6476466.1 hypothetical protein [Nocardia abscessus]